PDAVDVLVDDGPRLAKVAGGGVRDEGPAAVDLEALAAVDGQGDGAGVCAGRDDEVVLEPVRSAVVHEVDAGIDVDVAHTGIRRRGDGRGRAAADVAHDAGLLALGHDPRIGVAGDRPQPHDGALGTPGAERQ